MQTVTRDDDDPHYEELCGELYTEIPVLADTTERCPARTAALNFVLEKWSESLSQYAEGVDFSPAVFMDAAETFEDLREQTNQTEAVNNCNRQLSIRMLQWIEDLHTQGLNDKQFGALSTAFLAPWAEVQRNDLAEEWFGKWLADEQTRKLTLAAFAKVEGFPQTLRDLYSKYCAAHPEVKTPFPEQALEG